MKKTNIIKLIVGTIIVIAIGVLVVNIGMKFTEEERYVKSCFYSNRETFDSISEYFFEAYEPSINRAEYDADTDTLMLFYDDENSTVFHGNNYLNAELSSLYEKYAADSDYAVFKEIRVDYDNAGHMLLYFIVRNRYLRYDSSSDVNVSRRLYLVYMSDNFCGRDRFIRIAESASVRPFAGNWYFWSKDICFD